jgi:hypothetical protein
LRQRSNVFVAVVQGKQDKADADIEDESVKRAEETVTRASDILVRIRSFLLRCLIESNDELLRRAKKTMIPLD